MFRLAAASAVQWMFTTGLHNARAGEKVVRQDRRPWSVEQLEVQVLTLSLTMDNIAQ